MAPTQPSAAPLAFHRWALWFIPATLRAMAIELLVVLIVLVAAATVPMFVGNRSVVVMSGSMEPTIWTGSAVVAEPIPNSALRVDDVIVYSPPGAALPVVHRIISIDERQGTRYFITRGDANPSPDKVEFTLAPTAWRVRYSVPFAGYLIFNITKPVGTFVTFVIPIVGLTIITLWDWFKKQRRAFTTLHYAEG